MPTYNFKCENCNKLFKLEMKISEFLQFKKEEQFCSYCEQGKINQIVLPIGSKIDRDKEYIIQEAREEAKAIVEKMNKGDEKALIDICGLDKKK